ncbi:MAG: ATP-binding protein, partial [Rhodoplanes sp.]
WLRDCNHLAIVGPTGTGKSWLACALGNKACRDGFSVLYKRASRLFADLAQARGEGRLLRLMNTLERTNLIIIDLCAVRSYVELRAKYQLLMGI